MRQAQIHLLCVACTVVVVACSSRAEPSISSETPPAAPHATSETPPAAPEATSAPTQSADAVALAEANAAADELGGALRTRLLAAMREGGPPLAIDVCTNEASTITATVAEHRGARVGRGSLRMRGATQAPAWVAAWLREQGERPAAGVVGFARVEDGHARVLRPIAIDAPCLSCHGDAIAPAVSALLAERYPNDRAIGYPLGDLRGALYAEVDVR